MSSIMDYRGAPAETRDAAENVSAEQVQALNSRWRQQVDQLQSQVRRRTIILTAVIVGLLALFPYLGREHGQESALLLSEFESDFEKMGYGINLATQRKYTQAYYMIDVKCHMSRKPIWGIAILPRQLFVLHENSMEVEVYGADTYNFTYEMSLEVAGLLEPMDMVASTALVSVFISDWKKSSVFRIDNRGDVTFWSVGEHPHGLAIDSENNILVTCPIKGLIKVFTPWGRLLRQIKLEPDIVNPWHAIEVGDKRLAISHGKKTDDVNRVCIVDATSGKTQNCIPRFLVPLSSPIRLASVADYVVVADENNRRLLMLTNDLKYVWTLATELRGAMRLAADTRNQRLYVAVNAWEESAFIRGEIRLYSLH